MKNISKYFVICAAVLSLIACGKKKFLPSVDENPELLGWAGWVQLSADSGHLILNDFFIHSEKIDSIGLNKDLALTLSPDKKILHFRILPSMEFLSEIRVYFKTTPYSIIVKKPAKFEHTFTFDPQGVDYVSVALNSEINNWNPSKHPLSKENGIWKTTIALDQGQYQYLFQADGKNMLDPFNPDSVANGIGGFNSLLKVKAADENELPFIFTDSFDDKTIKLGFENGLSDVFVLWENYRLPKEFITNQSDNGFQIHIPSDAAKFERSHIRIIGSNEKGISNDVLITLHKGKVIDNMENVNRFDYHSMVLYFIMVDRFLDGDTSNTKPIDDPSILPPANYHGGDLKGITKKLRDGYFDRLGVNAIWISPINQNPEIGYVEYPAPNRKYSGYHGYWPISSSKIDHRFGKDNDLREMVEEAHRRNISVLIDFVSNHIHQEHPIMRINPEWTSSMYLPDGKVNIRIWEEHRLTTWFDSFMPDLDYSKPEVIDAMTDSALYWLEKFNLDGFRHDATKHVSEDFWRALTIKIKQRLVEKGRPIYQIGETFGSRELIGSYIGPGMVDGQFDFNFYFDSRTPLASERESMENVANSLRESLRFYGHHHLMGNITGNHDMARFISYASGALRFDEDDREAGWQRRIEVEDTIGYNRLMMLKALIFTVPGIPVIYYGDEIGIPGANDPDSRRMMRFDSLNTHEQKVLENTMDLGKLRRNNIALNYGSTRIIHASQDVMIIARNYFGKTAIIAFNRSRQEQKIDFIKPDFINIKDLQAFRNSEFSVIGETVSLTLKPVNYEILFN
ncbi:MAG: alpha-amylase family glycosyl hydrolase [Flavobacteriales bacterium]